MRSIPALSLQLASCLLVALPASAAFAANPINIVQVIDQSGPNGDTGRDFLTGAHVYFDALNAHGGINGRHINLVAEDDAGQPQKTVDATRRLVRQYAPAALFGYLGTDNVRAILADTALAKLPMVAPYSGVDLPNSSNVFYLRTSLSAEIGKMAQMAQSIGQTRIGLFIGEDALGRAAQAEVPKHLAGLNAKLTIQSSKAESSTDIERAAAKMAESNPQVIILAAPTIASADFVRAFQALRSGTQFLAVSSINPQTLREFLGDGVRWVGVSTVVPSPYNTNSPVVREYVNTLKKYRDEPPSYASFEGYLSARLLAENLRKSGDQDGALARSLDRFDADWGGLALSARKSSRALRFVDLAIFSDGGKMVH
ncbi:ABC transporter substrate-binding protein [Chitinimonas sp.]|uniref:ABC transporter substrate-binding protein n=1 Tax=Chitinimonas sp. TaxID=1934313 RepID=UPI0035AE07E6